MPGLNNEEYQVVIGNDTTSYIIDDLESARNYSFYIVAYMPLGASRMSDQVSQHTLEDGKNTDSRNSFKHSVLNLKNVSAMSIAA